MIQGTDRVSDLPKEFNDLEKRVKSLEEEIVKLRAEIEMQNQS